ncbi:MAG: hypothetical protein EOO02_23440 [Chitinophagaceae bacterium]|nr:MAG: hypothetical protein EOO02_23440 [Chitinophagaceae bacterium]
MPNPHRFYLKHMHDKTGYRATWDPVSSLQIGQIGKLENDGSFTVYSSLQNKGIPIATDQGPAKGGMDYTSEKGVKVSFKAAGKAPLAGSQLAEAEAGFNVEFSSDQGVVFKTAGHKNTRLTNVGDIEKAVLDLLDKDEWDKDWLIITEIVQADSSTVIISTSNEGSMDLKASGNVGGDNLKITDASLGLTVSNKSGSNLNYIATENVTPLYKVMGLRHPLFQKWKLQGKSVAEDETGVPEFREQDFDNDEAAD